MLLLGIPISEYTLPKKKRSKTVKNKILLPFDEYDLELQPITTILWPFSQFLHRLTVFRKS